MFTFQLGFLSVYLSDPLIEAFTSGASIHIITAQLGNLFGVTLVERPSYFSVPKVCELIEKKLKFESYKFYRDGSAYFQTFKIQMLQRSLFQ